MGLDSGGSKVTTNWPGGCRGWAAKSMGNLYSPAQAEMVGSGVHGRKWLREISAAGRRSSQRSGGKSGWVEEKVEMRWFLPVRIHRSATSVRCTPGGTNWTGRFSVIKN